eukprot:9871658-Lingulodinium_polyedra.AAC.1
MLHEPVQRGPEGAECCIPRHPAVADATPFVGARSEFLGSCHKATWPCGCRGCFGHGVPRSCCPDRD